MNPRGFTLLEILLCLLLVSLVLIALGVAVDFQLRVVDSSRGDVEEAQLARVVLGRIAADLRGAVPYDPLNLEALMPEFLAAAASSGTSAGGSSGGEGDSSPPSGGSGSPSASGTSGDPGNLGGAGDLGDWDVDEGADLLDSAEPPPIPGLYGGSDWLQVDIARLPRIDQFENLLEPSETAPSIDVLSDVKTVSYFVVTSEDVGTSGWGSDGESGGLIRRELDRAVASWAADEGSLDPLESDSEPFASEVSAIEFQYFDGQDWLEEWDSDENGGLPLAVEILMTIERRRDDREETAWQSSVDRAGGDESDSLIYRLVVDLPAARASAKDPGDEEAEPSDTEGEGSSGSANSGREAS